MGGAGRRMEGGHGRGPLWGWGPPRPPPPQSGHGQSMDLQAAAPWAQLQRGHRLSVQEKGSLGEAEYASVGGNLRGEGPENGTP